MAQPERGAAELSPDDPRYGYQRTPEQAGREEALQEVSHTLKEIEAAARRAEQARKRVVELDEEQNLEVALRNAGERLEAARKELFQTAYFSGPQQRLL